MVIGVEDPTTADARVTGTPPVRATFATEPSPVSGGTPQFVQYTLV